MRKLLKHSHNYICIPCQFQHVCVKEIRSDFSSVTDRFITQPGPDSYNNIKFSWRHRVKPTRQGEGKWQPEGVLVTDWALWSSILVGAASQIIKRDGDLWHGVITSHLRAAGASLSDSHTPRHFGNWSNFSSYFTPERISFWINLQQHFFTDLQILLWLRVKNFKHSFC